MILNPDKCHHTYLGKDVVSGLLKCCGEYLKVNKFETILGIEIDNKLNFESDIKTHGMSKTRGMIKNLNFLRHAKEKSSIQYNNKISFQLLPTCLDVLLKSIEFFSELFS